MSTYTYMNTPAHSSRKDPLMVEFSHIHIYTHMNTHRPGLTDMSAKAEILRTSFVSMYASLCGSHIPPEET